MLWLILTIIAYALLALVSIGDKYLLSGPLPDAATYAFYVGMLGALVIVLTPFFGWPVPMAAELWLALASGAVLIWAMLIAYNGLRRYEVSRLIPAIGSLVPIFTAVLGYILIAPVYYSPVDIAAFAVLVLGTLTLTTNKLHHIFSRGLGIAAAVSFLFALSFVLSKMVYEAGPFWSGFLWIRLGGGAAALLIAVFSSGLRTRIFSGAIFHPHPNKREKRTAALFVGNQVLGGSAVVLQSIAVYLVPLVYLAFINALQGVQYVFLFLFPHVLAAHFPDALPHE